MTWRESLDREGAELEEDKRKLEAREERPAQGGGIRGDRSRRRSDSGGIEGRPHRGSST